jgi:hypothetical protein
VIWTTILFTAAVLFFGSNTVLSAIRGRPAIVLDYVGLGALIVGYTIYTIVISFQMQAFMNEKVAKALPGPVV